MKLCSYLGGLGRLRADKLRNLGSGFIWVAWVHPSSAKLPRSGSWRHLGALHHPWPEYPPKKRPRTHLSGLGRPWPGKLLTWGSGVILCNVAPAPFGLPGLPDVGK